MNLVRQMVAHGSWLFRWRSYLPLFLVGLIVSGFAYFRFPFDNHVFDEIWDVACLTLALCGLVLRVIIVGFVPRGTSGRNTTKIKAPVLNTSGMYSLMRHPLYVANFIIFMAFMLFFHQSLLAVCAALIYGMYYERIMLAEEAFLQRQFGEQFEQWVIRTPAVVPRFSGWIKPQLPFCWRTAVRREYTTLFMIVVIFSAFEIAGDSLVEHRLVVEWPWVAGLAATAAVYLIVRTIKHWTRWLEVPNR